MSRFSLPLANAKMGGRSKRGADQIGNSRRLKARWRSLPTHELYNMDAYNISQERGGGGGGKIDSCVYIICMCIIDSVLITIERAEFGMLETLKGNGARLDVSRLRDMAASRDMALEIFGGPVAGARDRKEEEEEAEMRKRRERKHAGNEPRRPILRELSTMYFSFVRLPPSLSLSLSPLDILHLLSPSFFFSRAEGVQCNPAHLGAPRQNWSTPNNIDNKRS